MGQRANRREWSRRVAEWRRSGTTSKEYAAATGVNPSTLLWWSTQLRGERGAGTGVGSPRRRTPRTAERVAPASFVQVSAAVVDDRFELELGSGRRLRIPRGFDAEALGRLLAVLQ